VWTVYDGTNPIASVLADTLGSPADDTWYFVRVWHSPEDDEIGIEVDQGGADVEDTTGTAPTTGTTASFRFGANGSGTPEYFNGRLDDWIKWDRVLTEAEADERYNAGAGRAFPFAA
jgi:hypothetical protein